jgi:hypothetical protein
MALLESYAPPAFLPDFGHIPGQSEAWSRAMSAWFDAVIAAETTLIGAQAQYFNLARFDPGGTVVTQDVTWNAFPKTLLRQYGRAKALAFADQPWPIERYRSPSPDPLDPAGTAGIWYRPQDEYCEWRVNRDPATGLITRVTLTSEPPEIWQALFGLVPGDDGQGIPDMHFPGDRKLLVQRYREWVDPSVEEDDLIAQADVVDSQGVVWVQKGQYNLYNKWNTTHGIVHLGCPPNSLLAEIQLGGDATVLRQDACGRLLVEPDALIAYAGYGGPNRNSDPTIGSSVNALARLGAWITLRNPVGLYMDHIDLSGWRAPDGGDVADFVRIVRGQPGMIERLVIEAPPGRGFVVGDLSIAGEPIRFGGQVAECVTVKLTGQAHIVSPGLPRPPVKVTERTSIDPAWPASLSRAVALRQTLPQGTVEAFRPQGQGTLPVDTQSPVAAQTGAGAAGTHRGHRSHRGR